MTELAVATVETRARDLVALCKPRITVMVTATGVAGALAAHEGFGAPCWFGLLGTMLIVAGANALNMWIERDSDAQMERTRERPLAAGRLAPSVGLAFGLALSAASVPLLLLGGVRVTLMGVAAWVCYVALYTPMKRFTSWALPVGAVAGAMPPAMGWAAATGRIDLGAVYLFAVLFFWQLPHFVAIAIARGEEYRAAGLAVGSRLARAKNLLMLGAVAFVAVTLASPLGARASTLAAALSGLVFLALSARAAAPSAGRSEARDVFAFTMAHLAIVLVANGVR